MTGEAVALALVGGALGATLIVTGFGFAGSFRACFAGSDGEGMRAQILLLALASPAFAVLLGPGGLSGAFVAPAGLTVAAGAFVFGVGMQLANGCGSGSLAALGAGSARMLAVVPFFVIGAFWATLDDGFWSGLPAFPATSLIETFGWRRALVVQIATLAVLWFVLPGKRHVRKCLAIGSAVLAILATAVLPLAGHPWGVTWAFALAGAKIATAIGWQVVPGGFWSQEWTGAALAAPMLDDSTVLLDLGLVAGAAIAAVATGRFGKFTWPSARGWLAAVLGGLAMGYGARISGGCNIGAFVSGVLSFSPHGWMWIAFALAGTRAGIALRPHFGFSD